MNYDNSRKTQNGTPKCRGPIITLNSILSIALLLYTAPAVAQVTQKVRGTVQDVVLQMPIADATVTLNGQSARSNERGEFSFPAVPVGLCSLQVSHINFKEVQLYNVSVISGKETVLTISMEAVLRNEQTVIVRTTSRRNKPINEMSTVSARAFTVEETQKYAAAVNDPSRMATGFPGVLTSDDANNNIIIRGNSPTGLLWRMEGIDIPNPNHFSSTGSSGGGISILSAQLLSNSDFITGAFASEYGNALSGVFDLKLRKGNNQKREYTVQAGLLGLNAAAEGPLSSGSKGSYLFNYRYSTLELLNKIGIRLETGTTNFQDLSYHIHLPTNKIGRFSLFGFGGLSGQKERAVLDSSAWQSRSDRYHSNLVSNTLANGLTHQIGLGARSTLNSSIGYSYSKLGENYQYIMDNYQEREDYRDRYITRKVTFSSTLNHKFSANSTLRTGGIVSDIGFNYYKKVKEQGAGPLKTVINTKGRTQTIQAFAQWQYKPFDRLTLNGGLHYLRLLYNQSQSVEPRVSLKYQLDKNHTLAFGYGRHSQIQALGVYFARAEQNGMELLVNRDLDLTKAHHFVLSFQRSLGRNLALKTEAYYQHLYDVPVSPHDTNTFSTLNIESEYVTDPLVNRGKGRNYGIELSLEKYLSNHFYYSVSASFYESKYTALDRIERDTRFNGKYISTLLGGKEFVFSNGLKTFGVNIKTLYAGGLRTTPIDTQKSSLAGYAIYRQGEAYSQQNPPYFRSDLRISMKWNRKNLTSTLSLDVQNVTNRLNVYGNYFDTDKNEVKTIYQNGLIPVLNYKIEF